MGSSPNDSVRREKPVGLGGLSISCLAFSPAFAVTADQDGFWAVVVDLVVAEPQETGEGCQAAVQNRAMSCFLSAKFFHERDVNGSVRIRHALTGRCVPTG